MHVEAFREQHAGGKLGVQVKDLRVITAGAPYDVDCTGVGCILVESAHLSDGGRQCEFAVNDLDRAGSPDLAHHEHLLLAAIEHVDDVAVT